MGTVSISQLFDLFTEVVKALAPTVFFVTATVYLIKRIRKK